MARNISQAALDKLTQKNGIESILIIGIQWVNGGNEHFYADREIDGHPSVKPAIMSLSSLDSIVAISLNETSDEVSLSLIDTDGEIKAIIDNNDIHMRDIIIYQWFPTLAFKDKFPIFRGKINSPIVWADGTRTVSLNAVTQLEDREVGFSPEEGVFPDLPDNLIGQIWPECFGTTVHGQGISLDNMNRGTLGEAVGMGDFTIPARIAAISSIMEFLLDLQVLWSFASGYLSFIGAEQAADAAEQKATRFAQQRADLNLDLIDLTDILTEQNEHVKTQFRVIGGKDFPRTPLTLDISGAKYIGQFIDATDIFSVTCQEHPQRKFYLGFNVPNTVVGSTLCPGSVLEEATSPDRKFFPEAEGFPVTQVTGETFTIFTGVITGDAAGAFFAQAGSSVSISSNEPLRYIANISPGVGGINNTGVLKVAAFTTFESGERVLVDVPEDLYTVRIQQYGSIRAIIVEVKDALSKQTPSWEDTIYITFKSSIGPNPVDIMKYLIGKYSDLTYDVASFNHVRQLLEKYPMHFCLLGRKNVVTVLQELAFMARCAIFLRNGVFHLIYLPEQPASTHTFEDSNTDIQSLELFFTETEDLVTKFIGTWRASGAQDSDNRVIMRYNVKKYGIHEEVFNYYAYNNLDLVMKSMTYWLIRKAHTWKKLRFSAALDSLNTEVFDAVTLDFSNLYAGEGSYLGLVEKGEYDSDSHKVDFEIWTGIRAGETEPYDFAFPAGVSIDLKFPDPVAVASGFNGGGGPGQDAEGEIQHRGGTGLNVQYNGEVDPFGFGDSRTNDQGGQKPSDVGDGDIGEPEVSTVGQINFDNRAREAGAVNNDSRIEDDDIFYIDIRETEISDSVTGETTTLSSFFRQIKENRLQGDTLSIWGDADDNEAIFDFKFDTEGAKFGAGTAFLSGD